jgi:integration host factor subunit alpha
MALTKEEIIEAVAKENGFLKNRSTEIVESLLEIIKRSLESGEDVLFSGFGKFKVREKKARKGRNPYTGEDLMLEPRRVVTFHCSGQLRKKINR